MKIPSVLLTALLAGSAFAAPIAKPNGGDGGLVVRDEAVTASPDAAVDVLLEKRMFTPPKKTKSSSKKPKSQKPTYEAPDGSQYQTGDINPTTGRPFAVMPTYNKDGTENYVQQKQANAAMGGYYPEGGYVDKVGKDVAAQHRSSAGMPQRQAQGYDWAEDIGPANMRGTGGYNERGTYTGDETSQRRQGGMMPKGGQGGRDVRFDTQRQPSTEYGQFDRERNQVANAALDPTHPMRPGMNSDTDPYMSQGPPVQPDGRGGWQPMPQQPNARNSQSPLYDPDETNPYY